MLKSPVSPVIPSKGLWYQVINPLRNSNGPYHFKNDWQIPVNNIGKVPESIIKPANFLFSELSKKGLKAPKHQKNGNQLAKLIQKREGFILYFSKRLLSKVFIKQLIIIKKLQNKKLLLYELSNSLNLYFDVLIINERSINMEAKEKAEGKKNKPT